MHIYNTYIHIYHIYIYIIYSIYTYIHPQKLKNWEKKAKKVDIKIFSMSRFRNSGLSNLLIDNDIIIIPSMVELRIPVFWFVLRDSLPKSKIFLKGIGIFKQFGV